MSGNYTIGINKHGEIELVDTEGEGKIVLRLAEAEGLVEVAVVNQPWLDGPALIALGVRLEAVGRALGRGATVVDALRATHL